MLSILGGRRGTPEEILITLRNEQRTFFRKSEKAAIF